jgi:tRNA modification GTPase
MGTTRDVLEVSVDLGGYLCRFVDTAGLRTPVTDLLKVYQTNINNIGAVEQEGIRRAKKQALEADVVVILLSYEINSHGKAEIHVEPEILSTVMERLKNDSKMVIAINKSDLPTAAGLINETILQSTRKALEVQGIQVQDIPILELSCKLAASSVTAEYTKSGLSTFLDSLKSTFHMMTSAIQVGDRESSIFQSDSLEWEDSLGGSERQRLLLEDCASHLDSYLSLIKVGIDPGIHDPSDANVDIVLAAEELRAAADSLARITGRGGSGDVEEVLGVVFQK